MTGYDLRRRSREACIRVAWRPRVHAAGSLVNPAPARLGHRGAGHRPRPRLAAAGPLTGSLLARSGPWAFWIVGPETDRRARHPRIWRQSGRRRRGWGAMIPPLDTGEEELEHPACV